MALNHEQRKAWDHRITSDCLVPKAVLMPEERMRIAIADHLVACEAVLRDILAWRGQVYGIEGEMQRITELLTDV